MSKYFLFKHQLLHPAAASAAATPRPIESTHHSASFACNICHGAARSKRRHNSLEVSPRGTHNQPLQDNSPLVLRLSPSPLPPPAPTHPQPLPRAPVKWADLLTARLDTRELVDNRSQTRRASVSISPAEIASPPTAPPAVLTYLTGPQSFKRGQLDLLSWTKDWLVTTARTICLSVYSR